MKKKIQLFLPLSLTGLIILVDQITKLIVVKTMPIIPGAQISESINVIGDFLKLTHIRNTAIAFGLGDSLPPAVKTVLFIAVPAVLLILLVLFYFKSKEVSPGQKWILAAILGGGIGNMTDRFLRPAGVVDFIDVKVYGLFGLPRWPTFNVADSSIVISAIILMIALLVGEIQNLRRKKGNIHEQKS